MTPVRTHFLLLLALAGSPLLHAQAPPPPPPPMIKPVVPATTVTGETVTTTGPSIRLNFQGASLTDVLNYLSEAAGFVIVQEAPISGTVNVVSRQAVSADEAVDLLNAVLIEKGYIALRSGRILRIVNRRDAIKRDLPVNAGSDPAQIPRKDDIVTQILPLRTGEAMKLVDNLRPLLPESATITANEASNSIIMTDTQTNIRRIASIIHAIDSSISTISTIRVFPLTHADAKDLAEVLTQLFSPDTGPRGGSGRDRGRGGYPYPFPGMPGAPGGPAQPQSEAKQAATRVVCVADEQSNSVIVAAPEEVIPTIKEIILQVDTSVTDATETQIFRLKHADAVELAQTFNTLYADPQNSGQNGRNGRDSRRGGFPFPMFGAPPSSGGNSQSSRALQQARVVAVGDPRTNSLIVSASHDSMIEIATLVGRLDETDAKKQRVFVHSLQHADAENVATILRNMFGDTTGNNTRGSRLTERVQTGVETNAADNFSNSNNRGGGLR